MANSSHTNIRGSNKLVPSCSGIAFSPVQQPRSLLLLGLAFGLAAGSLAAVGSLLGGRLFSVPRQMFQIFWRHRRAEHWRSQSQSVTIFEWCGVSHRLWVTWNESSTGWMFSSTVSAMFTLTHPVPIPSAASFSRLIDPEKADENVLLLLRHLSPVLLVTVASLAAGIADWTGKTSKHIDNYESFGGEKGETKMLEDLGSCMKLVWLSHKSGSSEALFNQVCMVFLRSAPGPEVFEYPVDGAMLATKAMGSQWGVFLGSFLGWGLAMSKAARFAG